MSFQLGATKSATGFMIPPSTTTSLGGFQFGAAGDAKTAKPAINLTFTPPASTIAPVAPTSAPSEFSFTGGTGTTQFNLGGTTTLAVTALSFPITTTSAPVLSNASAPSVTATSITSTPSIFSLASTLPSKSVTTAAPIVSAIATTTVASVAPVTTTTPSVTTTAVVTSALTYSQLEDSINKWTIYLEDEGKNYANQAKQINAWDRLLITNGEKILILSRGTEHVKQQQEQLDHELDFILAQQKELEDVVTALEKELNAIPVTDLDRHRTYQMAETLDTHLKQLSEDLREIIDHLNESNKSQETTNPIVQIGRILNVHMNSLQWIDRNSAKVTAHLDQIAKMHDMNKRNHEINLQRTYE